MLSEFKVRKALSQYAARYLLYINRKHFQLSQLLLRDIPTMLFESFLAAVLVFQGKWYIFTGVSFLEVIAHRFKNNTYK